MNRSVYRLLGVVLLALPVLSAAAQDTTAEVQSTHYRVHSEIGRDHARETADHLEALLNLYNQQFRYPVDELAAPLRVRVFATKARYDAYLRRVIDETRDGFVYLHYEDPAKSELVGYYTDERSLNQSFIHQSFVQYFRTFVPHPPLWLREGFAVYFEAAEYDPEFATAMYRENLAWLDTLKEMMAGASDRDILSLEEILSLNADSARGRLESFYPQAWGMVSFLMNAESAEVNRIMWDSLSALEAENTLQENIDAVYREAFRWVDRETLVDEFAMYVNERRSFRGWVSYGVEQYDQDVLDDAESAFVQAVKLREDNYVPYYYLGLINYERRNYGLADFYFRSAMDRGADEAITFYALGVNAYADNRFDEATTFLEMSVNVDPSYRERAEDLLIRIRG